MNIYEALFLEPLHKTLPEIWLLKQVVNIWKGELTFQTVCALCYYQII